MDVALLLTAWRKEQVLLLLLRTRVHVLAVGVDAADPLDELMLQLRLVALGVGKNHGKVVRAAHVDALALHIRQHFAERQPVLEVEVEHGEPAGPGPAPQLHLEALAQMPRRLRVAHGVLDPLRPGERCARKRKKRRE